MTQTSFTAKMTPVLQFLLETTLGENEVNEKFYKLDCQLHEMVSEAVNKTKLGAGALKGQKISILFEIVGSSDDEEEDE